MKNKLCSLFGKYLLSYIIVLAIPFILLTLFIQLYLFPNLKHNVERENERQVEEIAYNLNTYFYECDKIVNSTFIKNNFLTLFDLNDVVLALELMEHLNTSTLTNSFITDIAFYRPNDNYVYTNRSSADLDYFCNHYFANKPVGTEEFKDFITDFSMYGSSKMPKYQYYMVDDSTMAVSTSMTQDQYATMAKLIFFIDLSYIYDVQTINGLSSAIGIFSDTLQSIFLTPNFNPDLVSQVTDGSLSVGEYNGDIISQFPSTKYGLTYVMTSSLDMVYRNMSTTRLYLYILLLLTIVLEFFAIRYYMHLNYEPIQSLLYSVSSLNTENKPQDFQLIQNSLDYLMYENDYLKENTPISSKSQLVQQLLKGVFTNTDTFNKEASVFDMSISKDYFCVFCFVWNKDMQWQNEDIFENLQDIIRRHFDGFLYADLHNKYNFIAEVDKEEMLAFKADMNCLQKEFLTISESKDMSLGVGGIYNDIKDIPISYKEATVAFDYIFVKGQNSIVFQSDIIIDEDTIGQYPHLLIEKFQLAFHNNKLPVAHDTICQIEDYIKTNNCPLFYARSICYNLMSIVAYTLKSANQTDIAPTDYVKYTSLMANLNTCDELFDFVKLLCSSECHNLNKNVKSSHIELIQSINLYINNNYSDYNFSVEKLANQFNMTLTNISNYYKSKTGETISNYITTLRMNKAKDLLLNTDHSLNQITEEIGYVSTSSFIRRFKSLYGVTPRQFMEKENIEL